MFLLPYRGKYVFRNLRHIWYELKRIKNNFWILKHFFTFRPYDRAFLYNLMGDAFQKMEQDFAKSSPFVRADKDVKSLKICKVCCKRLADDSDENGSDYELRRVLAEEIKRNGKWWW